MGRLAAARGQAALGIRQESLVVLWLALQVGAQLLGAHDDAAASLNRENRDGTPVRLDARQPAVQPSIQGNGCGDGAGEEASGKRLGIPGVRPNGNQFATPGIAKKSPPIGVA